MAKEKKLPEAYQNVHRLRTVMRDLYRACGLDSAHKASNPTEALAAAKKTTDHHLGNMNGAHKGMLKEALKYERVMAAQHGATATFGTFVQEAYELAQKIPSWENIPVGKEANQLLAITALLKTGNDPVKLLGSIRMIIGEEKFVLPVKPKPKQKAKTAIKFVDPKPAYNLTSVNKDQLDWGYQVPYWMIKKGQPMTWGACQMWVNKTQGEPKPGKAGDKFYVHPEFVTSSQLNYHDSKMAEKKHQQAIGDSVAKAIAPLLAEPPLHATDPPDDYDDEGSF